MRAGEQGEDLTLDLLRPSHAEPSYENSLDPIRYYDGDREGIRARAILAVRQIGGSRFAQKETLCIRDADDVELIFVVRSNFAGWDTKPYLSRVPYHAQVEEDLRRAASISFARTRMDRGSSHPPRLQRTTS